MQFFTDNTLLSFISLLSLDFQIQLNLEAKNIKTYPDFEYFGRVKYLKF